MPVLYQLSYQAILPTVSLVVYYLVFHFMSVIKDSQKSKLNHFSSQESMERWQRMKFQFKMWEENLSRNIPWKNPPSRDWKPINIVPWRYSKLSPRIGKAKKDPPTIFIIKLTLRQGIFDLVTCFSSINPSLDTPGLTGLFLQVRPASGTLYHLVSDLVFVPQNSNPFSKLILCHRFQGLILLCQFSYVLFWFTAPWTHSRLDMCTLQVFIIIVMIIT